MRRILALSVFVLFLPMLASKTSFAGRNAGGALIVHTDDNVAYTYTGQYCGAQFSDPGTCEAAVTTTNKNENTPALIWLLAAFPDTANPAVSVIYFGIEHNLVEGSFVNHGFCGPAGSLEIPDAGWPDTGFGNSLAFGSPVQGDVLFPFYWFAAYGTMGSYLGTAQNPTGGYASFVDDSNPPVQDQIINFGTVRWLAPGENACPPASEQDGPGDGGVFGPDSPTTDYVPPHNPTNAVSVYLDPGVIEFDPNESEPIPVESVTFQTPDLADTLLALEARTIAKSYPGTTLADTIGVNTKGDVVALPDISSYYRIAFDDSSAAIASIPVLYATAGVRNATVISGDPYVTSAPNDPHFEEWFYYATDAQWHLDNDGTRAPEDDPVNDNCTTATAGRDIHAQGGWDRVQGYGDSTVVIAIVDTGIYGGNVENPDKHEDLRVLPLTQSERQLVQNHPTIDWCVVHGTNMSGFAAALTNNAKGIAGICGNCSLLDVEVSSCSPANCMDHVEPACNTLANFVQKMTSALSLDLGGDKQIRVMNISAGGVDLSLSPEEVAALWAAYVSNVVLVASSADHANNPAIPHSVSPANAPFVIGVGGSTWNGLFWEPNTTCYADANGTVVGPSDFPASAGRGRTVDLVAPASSYIVTTLPFKRWCGADSCYYSRSSSQCSGAAAMVSGAAGLLQSIAQQTYGTDLSVDDVVGIIEASTQPYAVDPRDPSLPPICDTCSREQYGRGILNVEGAAALVTDYEPYWRTPNCTRIAGKYGDIIPGTWSFVRTDSTTVDNIRWYQYLASADVEIPAVAGPPPIANLPARMGWVRRLDSNTFPAYPWIMSDRIHVARDIGVTDCRLGLIDQTTGRATITGYDYAYRDPNSGDLVFLVPEDGIEMTYQVLCNYTVSTDEPPVSPTSGSSAIALEVMRNPLRSGAQNQAGYRLLRPGVVRGEIVDVGGRIVTEFPEGLRQAGKYTLLWGGEDGRGGRLVAGVYWLRLFLDNEHVTRKLILLK